LEFQFDKAKFQNLVLYTCAKCNPEQLGAVKLNKVLYFADMISFAGTGSPITGARYRKRPHGPTTDALPPTLRELSQHGAIRIEEMDYFGYRKKVYIPLTGADTSLFNETELKLLDDIIDFVCRNNTARTISELSHNRAWDLAEFGDEIPYHTAFYLFPSIVSEEAVAWAKEEVADIEAQRSQGREMVYRPLGAFRKELERRHRG
jgi:hypothetical protein